MGKAADDLELSKPAMTTRQGAANLRQSNTETYTHCITKAACDAEQAVAKISHLRRTVRICSAGLHLSLRMSKQMRPSLSTFG